MRAESTKPCRGCGGSKPPGRGKTYCEECSFSCDIHATNRKGCDDCLKAYNKGKYGPGTDRTRRNKRRRAGRYNLSMGQLADLETIEQCEVCDSKKKLCIDHDHGTGKVRGVLCDLCNKALGQARDNPKILRALADYVEER